MTLVLAQFGGHGRRFVCREEQGECLHRHARRSDYDTGAVEFLDVAAQYGVNNLAGISSEFGKSEIRRMDGAPSG
jgi:hypothetical protein